MKLYLPLLSSILLLASCSTAYKNGQTPDDVYYSPERQRDEYVRVEKNDNRQYQSDEEIREDRYLRMKTRYRRYATLDDCDCYCYSGNNYNRYYDYYRFNNIGYNKVWLGYNPYYYNPYYYNPYYNNPYYSGYVAGNVRPVYNKPRTGNLHTYDNNNNYNPNIPKGNGRTFNNSNSNDDNYRGSGTNAGGFLRNIFNSGNSSGSSSSSSNTSSGSSNSSSSGSGSSSSSSGSSSAPVRKF